MVAVFYIGSASWAGGGAGRETKKTGRSGVPPVPHRFPPDDGSAVFGADRSSDVFVIPSSHPSTKCVREMQFFDSLKHVAHFVFSKDGGPTNLNERSSCIQMHCARMHQRAVAIRFRNKFITISFRFCCTFPLGSISLNCFHRR